MIIIIVAAVFTVGVLAWQEGWITRSVATSAPMATPDETVNWKIYRNTFDDYLIEYPENWFLNPATEEGNGMGVSQADLSKMEELPKAYDINHLWVNVLVFKNAKNQSLEDWLKDKEYKTGKVKSQSSFLFSGEAGIKRIETGEPESLQYPVETDIIAIYASKNGKIYRITAFPWNSKFIPVFDHILSTFKFNVDDETANWKTYRNEEYGFTLKYFQKWQLDASSDPSKLITIYHPNVNLDIIHSGSASEKISQLQWPSMGIAISSRPFSESPTENNKVSISDWREIIVGGVKGYFYRTNNCAPKCTFRVDLPLENGSKQLVLYMTSDGDIQVFNNMLSTFRFDATTPDETVNWKTYRNNKYGFEIKYLNSMEMKIENNFSTGNRDFFTFNTPFSVKDQDYVISWGQSMAEKEIITGLDKSFTVRQGGEQFSVHGGSSTSTCATGTPVIINGINFNKNDVSGDYFGNQSRAVATEYCTVKDSKLFILISKLAWTIVDTSNEYNEVIENLVKNSEEFDKKKELEILNQMLSTFRFVE